MIQLESVVIDESQSIAEQPSPVVKPPSQPLGLHPFHPSENPKVCAYCNVPIDQHRGLKVSTVQKWLAGKDGKNWKRMGFAERQQYKQMAQVVVERVDDRLQERL